MVELMRGLRTSEQQVHARDLRPGMNIWSHGVVRNAERHGDEMHVETRDGALVYDAHEKVLLDS